MTIFVTGCTHYGHSAIIKFTNRPYKSVDEMNQVFIDNWNKTVTKKDTVYHLGDFAFGKDATPFLKRLNGNIVTIQGNHDPKGFGVPYLELNAVGRHWVMMHYPIEEWNRYWYGSLHVHCHTHKPEMCSAKQRFNVGVDATNYTPISLDELAEHKNAEHTR